MIDLNQKVNDLGIESLVNKRQSTNSTGNYKELPRLDVGTRVLYEKHPDAPKIKYPSGLREQLKIEKI